jgi:branched-chain amino acid transport system ATP-binding protein
MSILVAEDLGKSYSGFQAVRNVSFALEAGEMLALIGPNGAGKSTCFNMMDGQLAPTTGRIAIFGKSTAGMTPGDIWRLGVGRTFQVAATLASMTVAENVQMALLSYHPRRWPALPGRRATTELRRSGCWLSSAWLTRRNAVAVSSPTAISNGSNLRSRSPTIRSSC